MTPPAIALAWLAATLRVGRLGRGAPVAAVMTRSPARRFLLHHTHEGRVGLCASDDPQPPGTQQVIAQLSFEQTIGLLDDIDETLADCVRRDGGPAEEG